MVIYLKKLLQSVGILFLLCFSFMITEQTVSVVKEYDDIMIELNDKKENYYQKPIEATIKDNTFVPGIKGKQININKSYSKMRRYGKFEESLIEFQDIYPKERWTSQYDKYIISGNKQKNFISLIFIVNNNQNLNTILKYLQDRKIQATFFIDGNWLEKNLGQIGKIVQDGHELGNYGYNQNYENYAFLWVDNTIKKVTEQKYQYCYTSKKDEKILDICKLHKHYTIYPQIVLKENYYREIKKRMIPGSFIALEVNKTLEEQLPFLLNYILSKGYQIKSIEEHLEE